MLALARAGDAGWAVLVRDSELARGGTGGAAAAALAALLLGTWLRVLLPPAEATAESSSVSVEAGQRGWGAVRCSDGTLETLKQRGAHQSHAHAQLLQQQGRARA